MIDFHDAMQLIRNEQIILEPANLPLVNALKKRLAKNIFASIDLPPFDNSAVDGYAIDSRKCAYKMPTTLPILAKGQALLALGDKMAAPIMTGAPLPLYADAVIMKEEVTKDQGHIHLRRLVSNNENVRRRGEDIRKGQLVFQEGAKITPQLIGVLAALGFSEIPVFRSPKIAIIATGDELVKAGQALELGEVYYMIGAMLQAQCRLLGIDDVLDQIVIDDIRAIEQAINDAADADVILVSGGMSLGDKDLVPKVLKGIGVKEIFYQGAWRPGKPLFFGCKNKTYFFGLPGNPVAAFVCFQIFVRALLFLSMKVQDIMPVKTAVLLKPFLKAPGMTFFPRGQVNKDNELTLVLQQGSHQIYSLSLSNALAVIDREKGLVKAGELINYFPL
jgi:molybdopterin molybdotransferase